MPPEKLKSTQKEAWKVYLVGLNLESDKGLIRDFSPEESLEELASLAGTLGGRVVGRGLQTRRRPDPSTFIGRGKATEVAEAVKASSAHTVLFDADLSAGQERKLQKAMQEMTDVEIMDRTRLILEIFARRAKTREAKAQVELARMEYFLTHLTHHWSHLERQRGSMAARGGPGEKQIETDRRLIRRRILCLKRDLAKISRDRSLRRRRRQDFTQMALVGYTNAGKSTLLNALSDDHALVEDRLFATLDSRVRAMRGPHGESILLTDTVGFIRRLPARLIASFRSTFEEIRRSDLLLHVIDLSRPRFDVAMQTTRHALEDMQLAEVPSLVVFNKTDAASDASLARAEALYPDALFVSAIEPKSAEKFRRALLKRIAKNYVEARVELPLSAGKARASVHELTHVLEESEDNGVLSIFYRTTRRRWTRLKKILEERDEARAEAAP